MPWKVSGTNEKDIRRDRMSQRRSMVFDCLDRYRLVPYPSCSLRLFSLQMNLLEDFLQDLKFSSVNEQNDFDPLSIRSCSILNSIVYIADVIQQWKNRSVSNRLPTSFFESSL